MGMATAWVFMAQNGHQGHNRHDPEILGHEDGKGRLAVFAGQRPALLEGCHDNGGGGHGETKAQDDRRWPLHLDEKHQVEGQNRRGRQHLGRA
jgi:hypothetical protein